ncbi:MAG: hypothetical protein LBO72_03730 [Helicobacteraceae bacterium]|jgi:hypothetical protein|nr:hypothetical protein [Helicobacteraceae bacterium]
MGAANDNDNRRTIFLGVIVALLLAGFIAETFLGHENGIFVSFALIVVFLAWTGYKRYAERVEKRRLAENARKAEERLRVEEERRKFRDQLLLEEAAKGEKKKDGDESEPVAAEIKGEHYAVIVSAAFKRLGYDVAYRDINIIEDDAVHLIATRANEICLIHCSSNTGEVTMSEIELFTIDCAAFFKRNKFSQDDVRYVYALMGMISEKALKYIEKERKNNVPIEYRVIAS